MNQCSIQTPGLCVETEWTGGIYRQVGLGCLEEFWGFGRSLLMVWIKHRVQYAHGWQETAGTTSYRWHGAPRTARYTKIKNCAIYHSNRSQMHDVFSWPRRAFRQPESYGPVVKSTESSWTFCVNGTDLELERSTGGDDFIAMPSAGFSDRSHWSRMTLNRQYFLIIYLIHTWYGFSISQLRQ